MLEYVKLIRTYKSINLVNLESTGGNAPVNPLDDRTLNKHDLLMLKHYRIICEGEIEADTEIPNFQ